jgi:OmpA-OmpF porin, OOP family
MKKTILSLGVLFLALYSVAQSTLAITGGLHSATVTPNFLTYPDTANKTSLSKGRVMFGFVASVPVKGNLFFRAGVVYSAKGSNWSQLYDTANLYDSRKYQLLSSRTELNVNYIDIPLNLVYKLPLAKKSRFVVGAGPQLSLLYNGNKYFYTTSVAQPELDDKVIYDYEQDINKDLPIGHIPGRFRIVHMGANAFGGLEFNRVFLTVNYSRGLGAFYEEDGRDYKHQTIGASLGIFLGKKEGSTAKKPQSSTLKKKPTVPVKEVVIPQPPRDTDGDGLTDDKDKCPQVAGE